MANVGRATAWFCDPNHWSADARHHGCSFFGFYKPETDADVVLRECPSCHRTEYYSKTGDVVRIEIEQPKEAPAIFDAEVDGDIL
jgi:hypothetical protein